MRTPIWESSAGALATLLNSKALLDMADVYTLRLAGGTVYRWSGSDVGITFGGNTYVLGPGIKRTRAKWVVGVQVDSMTVTLNDILGTTINGQSLMAAVRAGVLDGARLDVYRVFSAFGASTPTGALYWFGGRVAEVPRVDRHEAQIIVKSDLEVLDTKIPRDVYQAGCLNTLYDGACGLSRSALKQSGTATSASNALRTTFSISLGTAAGTFDLGTVTFTSGANAGISRTVRKHTSGQLEVLMPLPFAVAIGDAFDAYPGCDKTLTTCTSKFSNRLRFRGQPFIPVPETVT